MMEIPFKKTQCSYCGSEYVTEVQYNENFEKFTAASKAAWVGLTTEDKQAYVNQDFGGNRLDAMDYAEKLLKERNT